MTFDLSRFHRIFILAVGKASPRMMHAALDVLGRSPIHGVVVAPRGQGLPFRDDRIELRLAGHPVPDTEGFKASQRVLNSVKGMREDDLLLCLISGGASALLPYPAAGMKLRDKIRVTKQLLVSGASIHEANTVRRHLSKLKGGRLLENCPASSVLSLLISDVPGNTLHDIGSGLTCKDPTSYQDAVHVLKRYHLWQKAPSRVRTQLLRGVKGAIAETLKSTNLLSKRICNLVIADNGTACDAAARTLRKMDINSVVLGSSVEMEAATMGQLLATLARRMAQEQPSAQSSKAVIIGGETTVHVSGRGKGGRNQQVAISAVRQIAGLNGVVIAALGTDGVDGNSDAAGAIIDGNTFHRARRRNLDPEYYMTKNNADAFFMKMKDRLITGPTGTNVGDVYLAISSI